MTVRPFYGREFELSALEKLYGKPGFQLVVLFGRRRIGKTTLIRRFIQDKPAIFFTAQEANDKLNLSEFSKAVYARFDMPVTAGAFTAWGDAFSFLAQRASAERFVLVMDEFPYACAANRSLRSILQNCIDTQLLPTNIFIILCGSQIGWMESEVLGYKSPLFGRRTAQLKLEPFDYYDAARFMGGYSPEDKVKLYSCIGGTPQYLSQIDTSASADENLTELYFNPAGYLFSEPLMLIRQELREPAIYNSIIAAIATGASKLKDISTKVGEDSAKVMKYINVLLSMEILSKAVPFSENAERSRNGIYNISDNCFLFWYKYVFLSRASINDGFGKAIFISDVCPTLMNYIGKPPFEAICRDYLKLMAKAGRLPIRATAFGAWWGNDPREKKQTDIDVVAADKSTKSIIIGECKWRETELISAAKLSSWMSRTHLLGEYTHRHYYLFSKREFPEDILEAQRNSEALHLVTADMLYN